MIKNIEKGKSGNPTQPGNRSNALQMVRKLENIIYNFLKFVKRMNWKGRLILALLVLAILLPIVLTLTGGKTAPAPITADDGTVANWQAMTKAWAMEAGYEKRYDLTDEERWIVASAITAEAKGEPYAGKVAVAQCILQACEDDGIRPYEVLVKYGYSKRRPEPYAEALEAVQAVFDFGHVACNEPIKYFYAPARTSSSWHESQDYVMTINEHKFFKEAE